MTSIDPRAPIVPLDQVPGAVAVHQVLEDLPCGKGIKTSYLDADGKLLRGDYCVVIDEGLAVATNVNI